MLGSKLSDYPFYRDLKRQIASGVMSSKTMEYVEIRSYWYFLKALEQHGLKEIGDSIPIRIIKFETANSKELLIDEIVVSLQRSPSFIKHKTHLARLLNLYEEKYGPHHAVSEISDAEQWGGTEYTHLRNYHWNFENGYYLQLTTSFYFPENTPYPILNVIYGREVDYGEYNTSNNEETEKEIEDSKMKLNRLKALKEI